MICEDFGLRLEELWNIKKYKNTIWRQGNATEREIFPRTICDFKSFSRVELGLAEIQAGVLNVIIPKVVYNVFVSRHLGQ